MHIDGWHIDGFGVFRGYAHRGLSPGLTVFHGPNEAGKSTLLAFLRAVLVGYPPRKAASHYPPLNGGTHGGRVFLRGPEGEIVVERMVGQRSPRVVYPDRVEEGEEAVRSLLGGVDAGLFNSVFAFSLTELQDLGSLTGEGVRERVFSAGIAGAGRSARSVIDRLEREADSLLRPRKATKISGLSNRLREAEAAASQARAAAAGYAALLEAEAAAEARVQEAGAARDELRRRSEELALLLELWEWQYAADEAEKELAGMEQVREIPAGSEERLQAALDRIEEARRRLTDLEVDRDLAESALERASSLLDPSIAELSTRVDEVGGRSSVYEDRQRSLPQARSALVVEEEHLARALADLGPDWDEDRVRGCDLSLARLGELGSWGERLAAAASGAAEARRSLAGAEERAEEALRVHERIRGRFDEARAPDPARLDAETLAIGRLKSGLHELQAREARIGALRAASTERERSLAGLRSADREPTGLGAGRRVTGILAAAAAVLAVAAVILGVLVAPAWGFALGAGAAALIASAVVTTLYGRPRASHPGTAADLERREAALRADRETLVREEADSDALRARIAGDAQTLGLDPLPGWPEVDARDRLLGEAREALRSRGEIEARLAEAAQDLLSAQALAERRREASEAARSAAEGVAAEWDAWKTEVGIPGHLGAEAAVEFLGVVREARARVKARDDAAHHYRVLAEGCASWEEEARALLREAGHPESLLAGGELVRAVVGLRERRDADRRVRGDMVLLEENLEKSTAKSEAGQRALIAAEEELATVLRDADASDVSTFRARARLMADRRAVETRRAEAVRAIDIRLGQGPQADGLRAQLATGRVEEWRREREEVDRDLGEAAAGFTEAIRLHRDAERARQELESSSDVPARELEVAGVREELRESLRRWQVLTAARLLIEGTLAEYSRTRQPPVLREASEGFSEVTSGSYVQIMERDDLEGFVVVDDRGGVKRPEELSRGTIEQLYLSLRFGLAREFGRRATAVPLIMDDVLVNFDPDRARATARVLAELSQEHQVLFFTCHPATAELLREVDGSAAVVGLGPAGPSQGTLFAG